MNHATNDLNNGLIVWYSGHGLNNGIFVRYSVHGLNNRPLDNWTCLDHFYTRLSPPYKFLDFKIFGVQNPLFFVSVDCCWSSGSKPKWKHPSGPSDYSYAKQTGSRTHSSHGNCTTGSGLYLQNSTFRST